MDETEKTEDKSSNDRPADSKIRDPFFVGVIVDCTQQCLIFITFSVIFSDSLPHEQTNTY